MSASYGRIGKEDALAAIQAASWTQPATEPEEDTACEHLGHGVQRIHTFAGPFGADWDLTSAEDAIRSAKKCEWVNHPLGHDLAVLTANDRKIFFDVRRPAGQRQGAPEE
jgi:hypothetical protein